MSRTVRANLKNAGIVAALYVVGIAASYGFWLLGMESEASFLLFVLGILIAVIETDSGPWGIALGVLYLLTYDLLFAAPHFSLLVFGKTDVITLFIFAVVALVCAALTNRLKSQIGIAERNATALRRLNKISAGLIDSTSAQAACDSTSKALTSILDMPVSITLGKPQIDSSDAPRAEAEASLECFDQGYQTGAGIAGYPNCQIRYLPLAAKTKVYGVVAVECGSGGIDSDAKTFLDSVLAQTVIAVERNNLEERTRTNNLKIERERFKTTLLRSVSHDLRTPLAGIQGNAELLAKNRSHIEPSECDELLNSISEDARWLSDMIDNLLSMTRVQDEDVPLNFQPEVVDDVIGDAVAHLASRRGEHEISMDLPDDVLVVPMDGKLIRQVLINLIDNAIKHSAPDSHIRVSARQRGSFAAFRVTDDKGGIAPELLDKIFGRFVSEDAGDRGKSGIGLGLSICKAIVEAHGGTIRVRNNPEGGATFEFLLPLTQDDAPAPTAEDGERDEERHG